MVVKVGVSPYGKTKLRDLENKALRRIFGPKGCSH
jgi:hypothetical protein